MTLRINGFNPNAFRGPMGNEFSGTGARVDSYSLARPTLNDLIECRYPIAASPTIPAQFYVNRFRTIARYEKADPADLPEFEEGVEDLSKLTLCGEITSRIEQLRDVLLPAHDNVLVYLQGFDADLPGHYDSKEFWLAAASAVDAKSGEKTVPDFSEDLLDDKMRALLLVGREEAEVDLEELAELAVLDRFANLLTDKI